VLRETENADWFFSVAAVADYRPVVVGKGKTPRQDGNIALQLRPTADILAEVCRRRPKTRCVGFAAQSGTPAQILKQARAKMTRKKTPYFVANDVACAGKDNCQLTLLHAGGEAPLPQLPKAEAARQLLAALLRVSHETIAARPAPARKTAPARAKEKP
jgi:phosphopantothenoylcysteine decarboxylase/phosphopantothenate--cysteine ligase